VTFRRALEHSYNIPAVRVGEMVGLSNVIATAHRLGVRQNLQAYPSLSLGAFEVSLIELTAAYAVFASQGLAFAPYPIERITDSNGDLLEQAHPAAREVEACRMPSSSSRSSGVTQRGRPLRGRLKLNIAEDRDDQRLHDAWFIGMTLLPYAGVWVGNDRRRRHRQGADAHAALIWIRIIEKMKDGGRIDPQEDFEVPANIVLAPVDYDTGLKPRRYACPLDAFVSGYSRLRNGTSGRRRSRSCRGRFSSPSTFRRRASRRSPPARCQPLRRPRRADGDDVEVSGSRSAGGLDLDGQRRGDVPVQADVNGVRAQPANRLGELDAPAVDLDSPVRERVGDLGGGD
jgi:membrane peptidoglycan carboxypeptidase